MQRGIPILRRAAAPKFALLRAQRETHSREWALLFQLMLAEKLTSAGRKLANAVVASLETRVPKTDVAWTYGRDVKE